jgi:hypothetical protein
MEVSDQFHTPAVLTPEKLHPGAHWIGGWVGPRAGLDVTEMENKDIAKVQNNLIRLVTS